MPEYTLSSTARHQDETLPYQNRKASGSTLWQSVTGNRAGAVSRYLQERIPAAVDISVTDYCNADCDFCGFAKNKMKGQPRHFIDRKGYFRALDIFARRNVGFVNFQGGEPLLHPDIVKMVEAATWHGMKTNLITNGWLLPQFAQKLADAGLKLLFVSIDSHDMARHEANRGLKGVGSRLAEGIRIMAENGIPVIASVTVSRLVDIEKLPDLLRDYGFHAVTFSYPRQAAFESSSLVFSEASELIDYRDEELAETLEHILQMKKRFPVLNPSASIRNIQASLRGAAQRFPCNGGYKYFYMDWTLSIWRCEAWPKPMGSVFEFDKIPDDRSPCTSCIMSCYRDSSAIQHAPLTLIDALGDVAKGQIAQAARRFLTRDVLQSALSILQDAKLLRGMCRSYDRQ